MNNSYKPFSEDGELARLTVEVSKLVQERDAAIERAEKAEKGVERLKYAVMEYGRMEDKITVYEDRMPIEDYPDQPDWVKDTKYKLIVAAVAMRGGDIDALEAALGISHDEKKGK